MHDWKESDINICTCIHVSNMMKVGWNDCMGMRSLGAIARSSVQIVHNEATYPVTFGLTWACSVYSPACNLCPGPRSRPDIYYQLSWSKKFVLVIYFQEFKSASTSPVFLSCSLHVWVFMLSLHPFMWTCSFLSLSKVFNAKLTCTS